MTDDEFEEALYEFDDELDDEFEEDNRTDEEMIAEAIKEARDAGISPERIRRVLCECAVPVDAFSAIITAGRLSDMARGRYGSGLY